MHIDIKSEDRADRPQGTRREIETAVLLWILVAGIFAVLANVIAAVFIE